MIDKLVLNNLTTHDSILIDTDDSKFVLGEVDFGTVQATHHTQKFLNQVGVYISNTTLGVREPSIQGWVVGDTYEELEKLKAILNKMVNPLDFLAVIAYDKYKLEFKPDSTIKYSKSRQLNNEVLCKFLIQGTCADPLFSLIDSSVTQVAYTTPAFKFPLSIPKDKGIIFGVVSSSRLAVVNNIGHIPSGFIARIRAKGRVVNPKLVNVNTQEFMLLNKTLAPGETVEVSTIDGDKHLRGSVDGVEENYFGYWDFGSTWMKLSLGTNYLSYTAESGVDAMEVEIEFFPKFLEVE